MKKKTKNMQINWLLKRIIGILQNFFIFVDFLAVVFKLFVKWLLNNRNIDFSNEASFFLEEPM